MTRDSPFEEVEPLDARELAIMSSPLVRCQAHVVAGAYAACLEHAMRMLVTGACRSEFHYSSNGINQLISNDLLE